MAHRDRSQLSHRTIALFCVALFRLLAGLALGTLALLPIPLTRSAVAQEVLTNDSVVQMIRAGLSEGVIVAKIRATQTKFDLRTDALVGLKEAGVSDKVIEAMVTQGAPVSGSLPTPPPVSVDMAVPAGMFTKDREVIYHVAGDRYKELVPTVAEIESNMAFFQMKSELVLPRRRASYRISEQQPVFFSAYAPSEAPLVRLKPGDDHDDRNLKFSSGAIMPFFGTTQRQGVRGEDKIDVEAEKDHRGLYRITPRKPLSPGEYGFVLTHGFAGGASGKIYDFGVD